MMPKLTGIEVCRKLREEPSTATVPIILITAKAQELDVERGFAAGDDLGFVEGDRDQLERVVLNLLTNAIKFTNQGGKVSLSAERDENSLNIVVSDTGMGIPAGEQDSS